MRLGRPTLPLYQAIWSIKKSLDAEDQKNDSNEFKEHFKLKVLESR